MHKHEKSALLGQSIKANAATAEGFDVADCPQGGTLKAAHQRCRLMIQRGELFKARVHYRLIRYFDTPAGAAAFMRNKSVIAEQRDLPKLTYAQVSFARSSIAKPKAQPAPRIDAEIIHTARTLYSSQMMGPGRYEAVGVPYQRLGTASWQAL